MKQEDKELLLKDLCGRLPYDVIVSVIYDSTTSETREMGLGTLHDCIVDNADVKPYLRSMSSMTNEERHKYELFYSYGDYGWDEYTVEKEIPSIIDWLNAHHFDYRGLIEKGLALEAPKGMHRKEDYK